MEGAKSKRKAPLLCKTDAFQKRAKTRTTCPDGTPPNPSTIDVMVGSPSKKQTRARDMLQSLGNLFLVRLFIYHEFGRV